MAVPNKKKERTVLDASYNETVKGLTTVPSWLFGKPTLQWLKNNGTESNGRAKWVKEWDRYGEWTAKLSPGIQSAGDDYASVSFVVNNMPLTDLKSIEYIYRMGATELCAPNIAIHVFDPADTDNRADITFSHSGVGLGVASGWQKFELLPATTAALFYYGNNIPTATGLTGDNGTSLYTLAQYQADTVFKNYVIGKITIEFGYYTAGYFSPAHICKIAVNDIDIPLVPSIEEQLDIARDDLASALITIPTWTFGEPSLFAARNSDACWVRTPPASVYQKSPSMWCANLYGGVQTNDDWASIVIPVNEVKVTDLTSAMWTYLMTNAESAGVNIVIWVHDPTDFKKRAEITQTMGEASKAAGWNVESLSSSADELFYYGENVGSPDTCTTAGTEYNWAEYQIDSVFSTWTIYRITLDYGWLASSTLDDAWVTEIIINGQQIILKPDSGGTGRIGHRYYLATTAALDASLAPKTPFRLLSMSAHVSATPNATENLTLSVNANRSDVHDTNLVTEDLSVGSRTSLFVPFGEGYEFLADDELDLDQLNSTDKNWGVTLTYQTVFP